MSEPRIYEGGHDHLPRRGQLHRSFRDADAVHYESRGHSWEEIDKSHGVGAMQRRIVKRNRGCVEVMTALGVLEK